MNRSCFLLGSFVVLFFAEGVAQAGSFSDSFSADSIKTYLPNTQAKFLVAGGGDDSPALKDARADMANCLRAAGSAMVMGDEALGALTALDDQAIVAKAKDFPIDQVLIIRLFPGAQGAPMTAVVTLYDKEGKVQMAFSVQQGQPLAPKAAKGTSGGGINQEAVSSVSSVLTSAKTADSKAKDTYLKKRLHYGGGVFVNQYGQRVGGWLNIFEGRSTRALEGEELYLKLGRKDLADSYSTRKGVRYGLIFGGYGVVAVGLALILAAPTDDPATHMFTGIGIASVGALVGSAGFFVSPNPVDQSEVLQMIDGHNDKLRKELGLGESDAADLENTKRQSLPFSLNPYIDPKGGGGVFLGMRF